MCTCAMNKISCTEEDDGAKHNIYQIVLQFLHYNVHVHLILVIYYYMTTRLHGHIIYRCVSDVGTIIYHTSGCKARTCY